MNRFWSITVACVAVPLVACSGAADSGLFGAASSSSSSGGGAGGSGGSGTGDTGGSTDDAGTTDRPTPRDGGARDATTTDAAAPTDASVRDAKAPVDARPRDATITCENTECVVGAEVCCSRNLGLPKSYRCTTSNACAGGLSVPCDEASDCEQLGRPGTVCCATYRFGPNYQANDVSCRPAVECTEEYGAVAVCNPKNPSCSSGTCTESAETLPGFWICN